MLALEGGERRDIGREGPCLERHLLGKAYAAYLPAAACSPRAVNHYVDNAVSTLRNDFEFDFKTFCKPMGLVEVEVLVADDRSVGVVDHRVGVDLHVIWILMT